MPSLEEIYRKLEAEKQRKLEEKRLQEQSLFEEYEQQRMFMMNDRNFFEKHEKATRGHPRVGRIILEFDDINNSLLLPGITDYNSISDWNTFFDLPNYGNLFITIKVDGNTIFFESEDSIKLKPNLFTGYTHLVSIKSIF